MAPAPPPTGARAADPLLPPGQPTTATSWRSPRTASPSRWRCLARDGLRAVDVEEATRCSPAGEARGIVGLCFDDGYADVARNAVPVLERHGFRATVFLPTGVIDGTAAFTWYAPQPPLLTWDEVRGLDRGGTLRFERPHRHPPEPARARRRRRRARRSPARRPRSRSGSGTRSLPSATRRGCSARASGGWSPRPDSPLATSCEPGVNGPGSDPLALRRMQIDARDRLLDFRAKVGGGHDAPPRTARGLSPSALRGLRQSARGRPRRAAAAKPRARSAPRPAPAPPTPSVPQLDRSATSARSRRRGRRRRPAARACPVSPSSTASGTPPTALATTGSPAAIASSTDIGMPSDRLARTNSRPPPAARDVVAVAQERHDAVEAGAAHLGGDGRLRPGRRRRCTARKLPGGRPRRRHERQRVLRRGQPTDADEHGRRAVERGWRRPRRARRRCGSRPCAPGRRCAPRAPRRARSRTRRRPRGQRARQTVRPR